MKSRLLGGLTLVAATMVMMGQVTKPAPTTTLTSSSPTLQLPGSLKLTAAVAPPAKTGGTPTGNVEFFNGTTPLGTGTLAAIPTSQNFSAPVIPGDFGISPFGLFTLPSGTPPYSVLGMLDYVTLPGSTQFVPQVAIFSGQGDNLFQSQTATHTPITNSNFAGESIDAYAIADFNGKKGYPDVLLHGFNGNTNQYYLLPGRAGNTFDPKSGVISVDNAPIDCSCDYPTPLAIIADDFNEDGYPDIAYAYTGQVAGVYGMHPIGIALNGGAGSPGKFSSFLSAPAVTVPDGELFAPTALASGHFTSSGHADLVVAGNFANAPTVSGGVALFLGKGDGTFFENPKVVPLSDGTTPTAIATADLRGNGMTDVVLANRAGATNGTNNVQVLFGDGKGGLTTSSPVTVPVASASLTIADFNNDGYPDILVTGTDGSLNLILNDGTGHFGKATAIGTTLDSPSLTTSGDFNGDGLADIAEITIYSLDSFSSASLLLNSASSQATLNTLPQTLPAGTDILTASFPSDNNFAASTSAGVPVTVTQTVPTISWPAPQAIQYGTALSATQLNASASVPGSFTYKPAAGTVLPVGQTTVTAVFAPTDSFDYSGTMATQTITVIAAPANATATAPATTETGQTASASLTISPYPAQITATLNLTFTPAPPNTVPDPAVLFPNNDTTEVITIPANSTTNQAIDFNSGSTAGTITLTIGLTAGGANVTPSTLTPVNVSVPAAPPVINSVQLTRSAQMMTATIVGLSSTRDMTQAHFHFTPASGKSLSTTDLTVDLSPPFGSWYGSSTSAGFGTTFLYTQPFILNSDATTVESVAVTLTNSKGDSQPSTAQ